MSGNIVNFSDEKSKDYLASIGLVIVVFNHLESILEFQLWELVAAKGDPAERQNVGRRITTPLSYQQKVDLLRALIVDRFGEDSGAKFKYIYTALQEYGEKRNDLAHSLWYIQYGSSNDDLDTTKINIQNAYQRGKQLEFSKAIEKVDIVKLQNLAQEISATIADIIKFFFSI